MKNRLRKLGKSIWFYYALGAIIGSPIGVIAYQFNWLG
ncbi:hypothetical protein UACE39S_05303 [Ureibacillus acetophenoni]